MFPSACVPLFILTLILLLLTISLLIILTVSYLSGCGALSGVQDFTLLRHKFSSVSISPKEVNFLIVAFPLSFFPRARAKGSRKRMRKFSFFLGVIFAVLSSER